MRTLIIANLIIFLFTACQSKKQEPINAIVSKELLQKANRQIVKNNNAEIDAYTQRHKWENVQKTGTGLRYYIYKNNSETKIVSGQSIRIKYWLKTLEGLVIIDKIKPTEKQFVVEKENAESGINEVLTYLHIGDKAKIILPPHLAFGLSGNENIPPMAVLVYDLEVVE